MTSALESDITGQVDEQLSAKGRTRCYGDWGPVRAWGGGNRDVLEEGVPGRGSQGHKGPEWSLRVGAVE